MSRALPGRPSPEAANLCSLYLLLVGAARQDHSWGCWPPHLHVTSPRGQDSPRTPWHALAKSRAARRKPSVFSSMPKRQEMQGVSSTVTHQQSPPSVPGREIASVPCLECGQVLEEPVTPQILLLPLRKVCRRW